MTSFLHLTTRPAPVAQKGSPTPSQAPRTADTGTATQFAWTDLLASLKRAIQSVIRGKDEVIQLALVTLFARGHLLIEDVPGVGKTTLAHALARSFDCTFQRIQFTSDLLPADVLGISPNTAASRYRYALANLRGALCAQEEPSANP